MPAKIAIVYYSLYGHVRVLAEAVKEGIEQGGGTCDLFQVDETLPEDVLVKMRAPPKSGDPVITDASRLTKYDGILFGVSGRYGSMPAQLRTFMDSTGALWQAGALAGKTAGIFQSTAVQGGGQETVGLTMLPFFVHHGMIFLPLGYANPKVFNNDEPHGASPYGAGTLANGDGSRMPSPLELDVAITQGKNFAVLTEKICARPVEPPPVHYVEETPVEATAESSGSHRWMRLFGKQRKLTTGPKRTVSGPSGSASMKHAGERSQVISV
jgi:NAD(P)H dehydrogenase (quinone)